MNETEKDHIASRNNNIQWHPGFCAAAEIELRSNRNDLVFQREYNLSKKPLQIDLLIVEKVTDIQIENEIGHIFRKYNVIEYKSPDDGLSIDDFFKTIGYAYLYKGLGIRVNQIPWKELSVSIFREEKPKKLLKQLEEGGCGIKKHTDGIYYIEGALIPIQIVVMSELQGKEHISLKILSKKASEEDVQNFIAYMSSVTEPGDWECADAVLQVSVSANRKLYDEMRRQSTVCEALRELMKDEIEEELSKVRIEGKKLGIQEGLQTGEERLNKLYSCLENDGRKEDIFRAIKDPEFLKELYKEYHMLDE